MNGTTTTNQVEDSPERLLVVTQELSRKVSELKERIQSIEDAHRIRHRNFQEDLRQLNGEVRALAALRVKHDESKTQKFEGVQPRGCCATLWSYSSFCFSCLRIFVDAIGVIFICFTVFSN